MSFDICMDVASVLIFIAFIISIPDWPLCVHNSAVVLQCERRSLGGWAGWGPGGGSGAEERPAG